MKKKTTVRDESTGGKTRSAGFFHGKSLQFTKKLKKLMKKYPTLPVAVLLSNCKYEDALDCEVGYVYDSSSGEFKEKVIAVFSGEENRMIDKDDSCLSL